VSQSSVSESIPSSPVKRPKRHISIEDKKRAVDYWKSGKTKNLTLATVSKRFRFVYSIQQLKNFEKHIENYGSREEKIKDIWNYTFNEFLKAKNNYLTVHDNDLKRWAIKRNIEISLPYFTASHSWLWRFKTQNRIVSRKITKFVTRSYSKERMDLIKTANLFIDSTKHFIQDYSDDEVLNTDQSGFTKELHSGRTLEFKGVRQVEGAVQSLTASTHSYTIMPTITKSGKLLSPLFIVLQEPSGDFGPRVKQTLFTAPNLFVRASSSGKLTKNDLNIWFEEIFFPNVGNDVVLLVDSWNTYKDKEMIKNVTPNDKKLEILTIPAKTTSIAQPLDKFGFRIWKNFVRKFSDRVLLDDIELDLFQRNNILKLQSLVHNQLSSPRFVNLFKYSWFACGYTDTRPEMFENPVEFCFKFTDNNCCHLNCIALSFMICSWCQNALCFEHLFNCYHYCNNYIE
jgi:hypothetical protein